jgi:hypothetical protein
MKNHLPISFLPSAVLWLMFNLAATNIGFAQLVKIDAISQKGILSWTAPLNSDCSVEWANIQSPTQWFGDWIKPGFFQVKWLDYQIDDPRARPVVYWLKQVVGP